MKKKLIDSILGNKIARICFFSCIFFLLIIALILTNNYHEYKKNQSLEIESNQVIKEDTDKDKDIDKENISDQSFDASKFYKPKEFANMNFESSNSKWSFKRAKQSEHFIVFWEKGFKNDPNSYTLENKMRVDIDDLLLKAEEFYKKNVETLEFSYVGEMPSYLEDYKMQIYLFYQEDWLATGAGYDDKVGAIWISPATCKPVSSTVAHEIGHAFQYMIYNDKRKNDIAKDYDAGFRYGHENSDGGNTFWEQCAQWQAYQSYPKEAFTDYNMNVFFDHNHRSFEHEWMRYQSYWLLYYWADKHGDTVVSNIWKNSKKPDDSISTYIRLYNDGSVEKFNNELYDYASKISTFDLDSIRKYANDWQGKYKTNMYEAEDGYYQVAYRDCLSATGFNVIELLLDSNELKIDFVALDQGAKLAEKDTDEYKVTNYNITKDITPGYRYGIVVLQKDGKRIYSKMYSKQEDVIDFEVPNKYERIYFVVSGAPKEYHNHPWNENELDDIQLPYKIKLTNARLKYFN